MSIRLFEMAWSCNADRSANDRALYVKDGGGDALQLTFRYKNAEPNTLYEMECDTEDLREMARLLDFCADLLARREPPEPGR